MFMCVVNLKSVNKLDLTWKQSFLILKFNLKDFLCLHVFFILSISNPLCSLASVFYEYTTSLIALLLAKCQGSH